jgi:hypothetical protein
MLLRNLRAKGGDEGCVFVIGHAEDYGSNTGGRGRDRRKFAVAASEAGDFFGDVVKKGRIS